MTKVKVFSGVCGFSTTIEVEQTEKRYEVVCKIDAECPNCKKVADVLNGKKLNMMEELFKKGESQVMNTCLATLPHISCPVPAGILKALEAGSGLALQGDATITFINGEKSD